MALVCMAAGPPAPDEAALKRAMQRGSALFWYDRAAWVTSDDLMVRLPTDRLGDVGGWIVTPAAVGYHADYFGKGAAADRVVYAADVAGPAISNAVVYPRDAAPRLAEPALTMTHALRTARAELARHPDWQSCAPAQFNTVVLPPESDGTIPVYFLTPQTENGSFPFGGHYEIDVAADGRIARTRAFTRACITLTPQTGPSGAKLAAAFLTHLLDPQPNEIHVFEQFSVGVPLYVGIEVPRSVWKVENGLIERAEGMKGF